MSIIIRVKKGARKARNYLVFEAFYNLRKKCKKFSLFIQKKRKKV